MTSGGEILSVSTASSVDNKTLLNDSTVFQNVSGVIPVPELLWPPWRDKFSANVVIAIIAMIFITLTAILGNVGVLVVIVRSPTMRSQLTYVFVMNLCVVDLLGSITILPVTITAFACGTWPYGATFCLVNGFLSSLFTFASILAICAISIERYYSIKMPMHYAANMTLTRALGAITFAWIQAILFAALPLMGWSSYGYRPNKGHCSFSWHGPNYAAYVITMGIICFVIPTTVMLVMYSLIYCIAKHTATQVHPEVKNNQEPQSFWARPNTNVHGKDNEGMEEMPTPTVSKRVRVELAKEDSGVSCSSKGNNTPKDIQIHITPDQDLVTEPVTVRRRLTSHWKAVRTLLIIMTVFMALWGPYFIVSIHGAVHGYVFHGAVLEMLTVWLGYSSFAANPLVYGLLNRTVREAIVHTYEQFVARWKREASDTLEDEVDGNEDFFQFLERTSTTRTQSIPNTRVQTLPIRNTAVMEELKTYPSSVTSQNGQMNSSQPGQPGPAFH